MSRKILITGMSVGIISRAIAAIAAHDAGIIVETVQVEEKMSVASESILDTEFLTADLIAFDTISDIPQKEQQEVLYMTSLAQQEIVTWFVYIPP